MPMIEANNAKFYYELHGQGPPIVLISGYGGDSTSWLPILKNLSTNFQILIFDNRGIGKTLDDGIDLSAKLMADDVIALCKALKLNKPHIIGRSMGGNIALTMAAYYPNDIKTVSILVSSAKWSTAALLGIETLILMQEQYVDFEIIFKSMISWLLGENSLNNMELINNMKDFMQNHPLQQTIFDQKRQFSALKNFDIKDLLNKIKVPTFIGYGKEDIMAKAEDSILMANNIPNTKLVEFNCGHLILLEIDLEKLAQELLDFLLVN